MKPGIYNIPDTEYFAAEGINNSGLKHLSRSPAHYYAKCLDPDRPPDAPTPSMQAGSSLHTAILEPHLFHSRHAILPADAPRRPSSAQINAKNPSPQTKIDVRWWNDWNSLHGHKQIISAEEAARYLHVGELIRSHPEIMGYMIKGTAEQSIFANDPETGILCKARPDWMTSIAGLNVVIDFKSTDDARIEAFQRTAYNFGYFQQAAFYTDVIRWSGMDEVDLWLFVAFERDAPHGIKVYEVQSNELYLGREQYSKALNLYTYCIDTGEWPSYDTSIEALEFPKWAKELMI